MPETDLNITSTASIAAESNTLMGGWIFIGFSSVKWGVEYIKFYVYFSCL